MKNKNFKTKFSIKDYFYYLLFILIKYINYFFSFIINYIFYSSKSLFNYLYGNMVPMVNIIVKSRNIYNFPFIISFQKVSIFNKIEI